MRICNREHTYHILLSKCPWAPKNSQAQKTGVGAYAEKPFIRMTYIHVNHKIIKNGVVFTQRWVFTQENTVKEHFNCIHAHSVKHFISPHC